MARARKCSSCGEKFTPEDGRVKRCDECREEGASGGGAAKPARARSSSGEEHARAVAILEAAGISIAEYEVPGGVVIHVEGA